MALFGEKLGAVGHSGDIDYPYGSCTLAHMDRELMKQLANHKDLSQFRRYVAYRDDRGVAAVEALR